MSNLKEQFNKFIDSLPERVNETPKKVVWEFIEKAIKKEKEAMAKEMIDVVKRYYPELNKIEDEIAVSFMYKELKGIAKNNKLNIE